MYRLYTRIEDVHSLGQCLITLDLTPLDFRSNPSLNYYIQHWFIDVDDLIDFLLSTLNKRITLIVTNLLAKIMCDILRPLFPQIIRIIIIGNCLCQQYEDVEYFSNAQSLVDHLSFVLRDRRRLYITFDLWPIERTSYDLTKHTAKYLWFSYFYTILSRLSNTNIAREEMLASIKVFHTKQTDIVKRSCEEFEQSYHSKDIFQWYTKSSFFYLLLNRTLRSEDINHIFAMRYVISDLENQLRQHCKQTHSLITTVYRGQQMYLNEIEEIKSNVGGLIGLTTFWSTTYLKRTAMNFTEIWPSGRVGSIESVLFTIQIPDHVQASVYLDISQLSAIGHELEVLFSFRSMFRVEQVKRNTHDKFWYVNLTLIDENDDQFVSMMSLWYSSTNNIIGDRSFFTLQNVQVQENVFRHLTLKNRSFLSFQLLIDMMLRLEQNEYARSELLQVCRDNYQTNSIELNKIDEFERLYHPRDAIKWYTTDCFLYRLINRSLRIESIDCIFKLRYFIHDLHNQLAQIQMEYLRLLPSNRLLVLELYRGLRMRLHELQDLQINEGNLVSTNTFLSTTSDYEAACSFSGDGNVEENFVSVIYRIHVDTTVKHSIPFAKIDYQSIFKDEDEVLFSIGAVFRIGQSEQIRDRLWIIELTLTFIEDEQWNILTSHLHSRS